MQILTSDIHKWHEVTNVKFKLQFGKRFELIHQDTGQFYWTATHATYRVAWHCLAMVKRVPWWWHWIHGNHWEGKVKSLADCYSINHHCSFRNIFDTLIQRVTASHQDHYSWLQNSHEGVFVFAQTKQFLGNNNTCQYMLKLPPSKLSSSQLGADLVSFSPCCHC